MFAEESISNVPLKRTSTYSTVKFIGKTTVTTSEHHRADHEFAQGVQLSTQRGVDVGVAKTEANVGAVAKSINSHSRKDESGHILS